MSEKLTREQVERMRLTGDPNGRFQELCDLALSAIESGEQEVRDARLGAAVRRMLSEGPWNLEDSPKSFLSNCKRLAQESAAIEGEKHDPR